MKLRQRYPLTWAPTSEKMLFCLKSGNARYLTISFFNLFYVSASPWKRFFATPALKTKRPYAATPAKLLAVGIVLILSMKTVLIFCL